LGIADAVKFTGWVGPSGKRALLESAAVFALPSYDEALPLSLLEAMSAGVPAVVSPVGGIPEVVVDGVSGLLVAPGDVATLERRGDARQLAARLLARQPLSPGALPGRQRRAQRGRARSRRAPAGEPVRPRRRDPARRRRRRAPQHLAQRARVVARPRVPAGGE